MNGGLEEYGFAIMSAVIDASTIVQLLQELRVEEPRQDNSAEHGIYARRNLFQTMPGVCRLAASRPVRTLVEPSLGAGCFAVRAIYFDKPPGANWKVPWHQDLSVALASRRESEGFGPWSRKAGVVHA